MAKKITTTNDLAQMVKRGFDDVTDKMTAIKQEVTKLAEHNETAHEDIKLRLDNVAYRFELQDLEKRVKFLEEKAKFA